MLLPRRGFMPIVPEFPYLGDMVARDGSDGCAVDKRITKAGKAFGALRKCVFSTSSVSHMAKRAVYESIILSILLYGAESWSMTEQHRQHLRVFHAQCLRAMCRVTRKHTWDHHISTQELGQRLGIETIDTYITRRQLRWGGHVRRMDYDRRLPRRMLSSWVAHPRPRGAPKMTYGRSFCKALKQFHIDQETWPELAADRSAWRATLRLGQPAIYPPSGDPRGLPNARVHSYLRHYAHTRACNQLQARPLLLWAGAQPRMLSAHGGDTRFSVRLQSLHTFGSLISHTHSTHGHFLSCCTATQHRFKAQIVFASQSSWVVG